MSIIDKQQHHTEMASMTAYHLHDGNRLAYSRQDGQAPGVMFLGGYRSDITGTKASFLAAQCAAAGQSFLRFDYRGHGRSEGRFRDACIGDWRSDALALLDHGTAGKQILVGSSMGGWLALLVALARPERVAGFVGVAAAPDFTEDLIRARLSQAERAQLLQNSFLQEEPAEPDTAPAMTTLHLIEEGRNHLLLRKPVALHCPVRLLHGQQDADVPWQTSLTLMERLTAADVRLELVKDGDHRLNRPQDCALLWQLVQELVALNNDSGESGSRSPPG